jgi:hypothetical protein
MLLLRPLYESWLLESTQAPLPAWKRRLLKDALSKDTALRCLAAELAEFTHEAHAPAADKAPDMRTRVVARALAPEPERALFPSGWVPAGGIAVLLLLVLVALFQRPSGPVAVAQSADNMNDNLSAATAPPAASAPPAVGVPSTGGPSAAPSVSPSAGPVADTPPSPARAASASAAPVPDAAPVDAAAPVEAKDPSHAPAPVEAGQPSAASTPVAAGAPGASTTTSSLSGTAATTPGVTPGANPTAHP